MEIDYSTIVPTNGKVVIKRLDKDDKVIRGLWMQGSKDEFRPHIFIGKILAVGLGEKHKKKGYRKSQELEVGMFIMYGRYSGTDIRSNTSYFGEDLTVIPPDEVLAVIENATEEEVMAL